jgi:ribosome-binding factor A
MGRIEKVNQQLKREISIIIQQDLGDPRIEFVTITSVDVSRDLRNAKVLFSVLGEPSKAEVAQKGLEGARGMIRKLIGQRIKMRFTPDLSFVYDHSIELSARIEETLKGIHDELEKNHPDRKKE